MAKIYGLSAADRKLVRDDHRRLKAGGGSQRPVPKRRRGPRGGGGGKSVQYGLVIATIPGATLTGSPTYKTTFGSAGNAVVLQDFDDDDNLVAIVEDGSPVKLTGFWRSKTAFRASEAEPVAVTGERRGDVFIIHGEVDLRFLPGFLAAEIQIPYKKPTERTFQLGATACP